jgi:hypothetical protein
MDFVTLSARAAGRIYLARERYQNVYGQRPPHHP